VIAAGANEEAARMCLGIPGRVVEIIDAEQQRAVADVDGVRREISLSLLGIREADGRLTTSIDVSGEDAVGIDDWVLIHVGFAMSKIDEEEAAETLKALRAYGDAYDQELDEYAADGAMDPLEIFAGELPSDLPDWARPPAGVTPDAGLGDPTALPPREDGVG
jgi:hydrogenase expression/formation protein HypC